uniref:Flavin-containing monooxygenase n=1 Tax=Leersia perrieri TaxID=77586 RepID=A0A0D9XM99_9ORYZ
MLQLDVPIILVSWDVLLSEGGTAKSDVTWHLLFAPMPSASRRRTVAVVGAGAAGIVAARELLREGHAVTVFERSDRVGGTWAYDPRPDLAGAGAGGVHVSSSMYASLRTNLPRELMGFSGFDMAGRVFAGDARTFPGHREVLAFLAAFAEESGVSGHVRLRAEVVRVVEEVFDAVVVCNGHCTVPLVPKLRGIGNWKGKQMHSHNYRTPEPFQDQIVIVIGLGASGVDIAREVSKVAKEVHIASRYTEDRLGKVDMYQNVWLHSEVDCIQDDGQVRFSEGSVVAADTILYCTGYRYHFPFLDMEGLTVDDNRVGPLYKHVFPPKHAPNLSFVGLPVKTIIFQLFELESRWVARALSGRAKLPSSVAMAAAVEEDYQRMEAAGKPKRHTHSLMPDWVEYMDWLAAQVGEAPVEERRREMYEKALRCIWSMDDSYRDNWEKEEEQSPTRIETSSTNHSWVHRGITDKSRPRRAASDLRSIRAKHVRLWSLLRQELFDSTILGDQGRRGVVWIGMINTNKMSKQECMVNLLSEDVLANILCCLAPRHLAISRSVCEPWCKIIDGHRLLRADLLPHSVGGIYIKFYEMYPTTFFSRPSTGPTWVQLPPKPHRKDEYLVFDPTLSPHYEVLQIPYARNAMDPSTGGLEWPQPTFILHVFSSRTNKWKERLFVREGVAVCKVSDLESNWGHIQHNAVYWKGVLYVNCESKFVMRISLSNEKYQVIEPPGDFSDAVQYHDFYLGKSEKGVYCATFYLYRSGGVRIYILNESCGELEWVFKCNFDPGPVLELERIDRRGSWTLQEFEDNDNEATENGDFEATVERNFDWDSDDNDGVIVPAGPNYYHRDERRISFLGFHPYKEVVFLSENISRGLAYHLNSSKLQDLGHLRPKYYDSYGNRIIFSIHTLDGKVSRR